MATFDLGATDVPIANQPSAPVHQDADAGLVNLLQNFASFGGQVAGKAVKRTVDNNNAAVKEAITKDLVQGANEAFGNGLNGLQASPTANPSAPTSTETPVDNKEQQMNAQVTAQATKSINSDASRVQQAAAQNPNFNPYAAMNKVFMKAANTYGYANTAEVFSSLYGKSPVQLVTEDMYGKEVQARETAQKSYTESLDKFADKQGMIRLPGETNQTFYQRVYGTYTALRSGADASSRLESIQQGIQAGALDAKAYEPQMKMLEGQVLEGLPHAAMSQADQITANFNPATATPDQRMAVLKQLQQLQAQLPAMTSKFVYSQDQAHTIMTQLNDYIGNQINMVNGKTTNDVYHYQTQTNMDKKILDMQLNVPGFSELQGIGDALKGVLNTSAMAKLDFTNSTQNFRDQLGNYMTGRKATFEPTDWNRLTRMSTNFIQNNKDTFGPLVATNSFKQLAQSFDGAGNLIDATGYTGVLQMYGDRAWYKQAKPYLTQNIPEGQYKNIMESAWQNHMIPWFNKELQNAPPNIRDTWFNQDTTNGKAILIDVSPNGNIRLGNAQVSNNGEGKPSQAGYTYWNTQDPRVTRLNNFMGTAVRAYAHTVLGSDTRESYAEAVDILFRQIGKKTILGRSTTKEPQ